MCLCQKSSASSAVQLRPTKTGRQLDEVMRAWTRKATVIAGFAQAPLFKVIVW